MSEHISQESVLKELKNLVESSSLVTARLIEAVSLNSQLASSSTPEMQDLFHQWINYIAGEILNIANKNETVNVKEVAESIGVCETTILSLLLYLERNGSIIVENVTVKKGKGENQELCHCLRS
ncbi:MAG: hypothetical protein WCQ97_08045 [Aminobacterium sp.]|jgi:predicted transcriptional regulator|uniref:hypothetical protein n=1 Tax=unclassified Aminobacterium TaxID=2685012 RepID=UPI001BCBF9FC|nr:MULTISPECIES: hypothetical protein [unclassified Aminobacterium]MDD2207516.1 hypothetical protein [Aminobacterium sp.]MDD3426357.1 hypothetical protein [Aminobacterium sp.]MDD3707505.1 hypothetical protein [Aminobacterium sp.]MDD4229376.1 hypothetical protein [Aminobacterium sp.]MDD4552344.1 hypothetical protein [Aminobacterium sp.]